jgi:long-chain fatty acid transport protein
MKRNGVALCIATLATAVTPTGARAQGFGLNEIGSCAVGRGFAVTGSPCRDASAIYWNPAATTQLEGVSILAGAAAIAVKGSFRADVTGREDETDVPTEVPPHAFVNWKFRPNLALGLGVYVPYGLTSQWREDFAGRFAAQKASLATIYVQPNVAFDVVPGRLSIGGGPVIGHSTVELRQSLDVLTSSAQLAALSAAGVVPGTEFGRARLEGSAMAYGAHVGVFARPVPTLTFGVRYLTALDFKYDDADATFTQTITNFRIPTPTAANPGAFALLDTVVAKQFQAGQPLGTQKVSTRIKHPAQIQVGVGFSGIPNTTLSLDGAYVQWSSFKELTVDFASATDRTLYEDYENIWSIRTGIEHRFGMGIAGRAGFSFAQTPAPDVTVTPLLPDMDRYNFNLGVGIPLGARFALDAGYLRVETEGRRGRIVERTSRAQTATQLNSGAFGALTANIFSLSLKAQL